MADSPRKTRRTVLRTAGATLASLPLAGCEGVLRSADTGATPTLTPAPPPMETVVVVGPGGELVFDPADLRVSTGTTVVWE